ncbi:uncharacterized protein LOC135499710 [Lineus longissimus]|uniref:uncharacterized protein LOC135499710 n=1 Tax=Lineus longissimus TaxID=88925 RepID=UPI00315D4F5A
MATLGQLKVLNDSAEHQKILVKLSRGIQDRWLKIVDDRIYGKSNSDGEYPSFAELYDFLQKQSRIASNPLVDRSSSGVKSDQANFSAKHSAASSYGNQTKKQSLKAVIAMATSTDTRAVSNNDRVARRSCVMCNEMHELTKSIATIASSSHRVVESSSRIPQALHVQGDAVKLMLSTVLGKAKVDAQRVDGLCMTGIGQPTEIALPVTYSRGDIPAMTSQIPRPETAKRWSHLQEVSTKITAFLPGTDIDLLIGTSCAQAIRPLEVVPGGDNDPYGIRTTLRWGVIGNMRVNHASNNQPSARNCHFTFSTTVKEVSPAEVSSMFEIEFSEREEDNTDEKISAEDKRFLQSARNGIHVREDNHYEMPLPIKDDALLPNNKPMVQRRLMQLKGKLAKSTQYHQQYTACIEGLIAKGYAERVPDEEPHLDNGRVWYVQHFGVYHQHKPNSKVCVVFDCSAQYNGEALNRHLLQGPDLNNGLVGMLVRFRKGSIGSACDIEGMYHQVGVDKDYRNLLRFLWWDKGDLTTQPTEYRMTAQLFGAASSLSCAKFALRTAADEFESKHGKLAADFVRDDFYVDDGVTSLDSVEDTLELVTNSIKLCGERGFRLHRSPITDGSLTLSQHQKEGRTSST